MKDQFYLHFPNGMPKGTAQQKRYNSKTRTYYKDEKLLTLEQEFLFALKPHRPKTPSAKDIRLVVWFAFDTKNRKLWGKTKPTAPDTDNYIKEFKDCMVKAGFFVRDSQVVSETVFKSYAESATIMVMWEELIDRSDIIFRKEFEK